MITITRADGTVETMTESEFRARRGDPARTFSLPRKPKHARYYAPQGNGVEARFGRGRTRRRGLE